MFRTFTILFTTTFLFVRVSVVGALPTPSVPTPNWNIRNLRAKPLPQRATPPETMREVCPGERIVYEDVASFGFGLSSDFVRIAKINRGMEQGKLAIDTISSNPSGCYQCGVAFYSLNSMSEACITLFGASYTLHVRSPSGCLTYSAISTCPR